MRNRNRINKKSTNNRHSRYVQGGDTVVWPERLGWWERKNFKTDPSDQEFTITPEYHHRPSKLAYDYYGMSEKMFLILQYNCILDINKEFVTGAVIKLPLPERVSYDMFNKQIGGISPDES